MKKIVALLVIALMLSLILPACTSTPAPTSAPAPTSTAPAPTSTAPAKPIELIFSTPGPEALPEFTYKGAPGPIKESWSEITKRTNGAITFKTYYAGSLNAAGAVYDAVATGAVDFGIDQPSYNRGKFPYIEILELPWGYPDAIAASKIAYDALQKFQPPELKAYKIMSLRQFGHPVLMSTKPVRNLNDIKGMKVRGTGNMNDVITALGAAPVSMPIFEIYDALRKGTIDGALTGPDNWENYKLHEVTKYATDFSFLANGMLTLGAMNLSKFNSLPANYQKVITDVYTEYNPKYWQIIEKTMTDGFDYARSKGVEIITISAAEQPQWKDLVKKVTDKYVADAQAKGTPAQDIAKYVQDAIAAYTKK